MIKHIEVKGARKITLKILVWIFPRMLSPSLPASVAPVNHRLCLTSYSAKVSGGIWNRSGPMPGGLLPS